MPQYTLRVATISDTQAVTELLHASYPKLTQSAYDASVLSATLPAMTQANPVLLASEYFYLAETEEGLVVGCGGWSHERPGKTCVEQGLAHLRHFATHPAWLGRGIGRSIYQLCENQARTADVNQFECYSSLNAELFYTALGFNVIERMDICLRIDQTIPTVLMRRRL